MSAAYSGSTDCVALLTARGGYALELNVRGSCQWTALQYAPYDGHAEIVQLLLLAGADPSIPNNDGKTPLDHARYSNCQMCIALLMAALTEPQRPRLLLKARALLDASYAIRKARTDARDKGLPAATQQQEAEAAAPPYLKRRVQQGQQLPRVTIAGQDEQLVACVKYALGLEGGGAVQVVEGQAPQVGMVKEVFVELCELLAPKWARKDM